MRLLVGVGSGILDGRPVNSAGGAAGILLTRAGEQADGAANAVTKVEHPRVVKAHGVAGTGVDVPFQ